jgi:hypothetical protein
MNSVERPRGWPKNSFPLDAGWSTATLIKNPLLIV